jgi:hypothetical protein
VKVNDLRHTDACEPIDTVHASSTSDVLCTLEIISFRALVTRPNDDVDTEARHRCLDWCGPCRFA